MVHAAKEHIIKVLETVAGCTIQNHLSQFQLTHIFEFLESKSVSGLPLITNPLICNVENIYAVSAALKNVQIVCGDYSASKSFIDKHTLVYLDPPYRPLKGRDSFISYTETEFDDSCQRALAGFIEEINASGAYIILSNSDPKNVDPEDDFFEDLYIDYDVQRIQAKRRINRNADLRGYITELLIKNY